MSATGVARSRRLQHALGLLGRRVIGKPIRTTLPELADQGFHELLDRVYRSGERYVGHVAPVMLQRQPGSPLEQRLLDFIYQPVRNAMGNVTGIWPRPSPAIPGCRPASAIG
ncbi:MAG: hypothetical protein K2X72_36345 [Reyranella sp.]|nr:hypothetical protein [Reyranella sp.]